MKKTALSRRTFLKGMLAGATVSIALPPLEAFMNTNGTAYASGDGFPKRFGLFYWGNGVHPELWIPSDTGRNWTPSQQLTPFVNLQNDLAVLTGFEVRTPNDSPHLSGPAGLLSGAALLNPNSDNQVFQRPSLDQVLAAEIGGETRFRSLEVGIEPGTSGLSYIGPESRNPPECDPALFFERIFGAGFTAPGDEPIVDPKLALRRSVLDVVMGNVNELNKKLGASDKIRVDRHLDAIRDLELRIARMEEDPPSLAACSRPAAPSTPPDVDGRPAMGARAMLMTELSVMAYACDLTRVLSFYYSDGVSNCLYPNATAGHHQLTHDEPGDMPQVQMITQSIMEDFAFYLEALRAVPEGESNLLNNSLILGTTDVSYARTHQIDEYPLLLAGTAGGAIQTGMHYRSTTKENASEIPFTILNAMGVVTGEWGLDEGRVTSGVGALEL